MTRYLQHSTFGDAIVCNATPRLMVGGMVPFLYIQCADCTAQWMLPATWHVNIWAWVTGHQHGDIVLWG